MKRLILSLLWVVTAALPLSVQAQVYARAPAAPPPPWGPGGYPQVQYYYLPDLQMYYHVPAASFILFHRGQWIAVRHLPPMYRSYDLYAAPKVILDYHGPYPFAYHEVHRRHFPRWHCAPHSVVVYRGQAGPPHPHHPRWRYRYNDDYQYDRRWDDRDRRYEYEPRYDQREDQRPYDERYRNEEDRWPDQEPRREDRENEYEYDRYDDNHRRYGNPPGNRW